MSGVAAAVVSLLVCTAGIEALLRSQSAVRRSVRPGEAPAELAQT